jgi:hypothetical protein
MQLTLLAWFLAALPWKLLLPFPVVSSIARSTALRL